MTVDYRRIGARAMKHVRHLAVDIGPRGSATEGERRGSEYAAAEMRRWAQGVSVETFRCSWTYSHPWLVVGALIVASAILLWFSPVAALVVAAVNLPIYVLLASGRGEVGRLFPKRQSQNAWGRVPAGAGGPEETAPAAATGAGRAKPRKVVLLAHVDSTRAALLFKPSALKSLRMNHMVNLASVLGMFVLSALVVVVTGLGATCAPVGAGTCAAGTLIARIAAGLGSVFALIALYGSATLVHREVAMPVVHGANDNASGVGLTLAIGEHYAAKPLANTEVWCVATGAEESGYPAGAKRFIDRHRAELREEGTVVIVLDNLGTGELRHLTAEGIILPLAMDKGLLDLARRLGRTHADWKVRDSVCNLGYTDATPAILAGLRTIALWAEGPDGLLINYHWPTDTFEKLEPETIERAATLILEMVEAIDRGEDL